MDQNLPYTPTPLEHAAPSSIAHSFTPIKNLLSLSWEKVQKHLLKLFLLTIVPLAIGGASLFLWFLLIILMTTVGSASLMNPIFIVSMVLAILVASIGFLIIHVSTILVLADTQPLSLMQVYKLSLKKIWPLLVVSLLSSLIVIGGVVMFIIPGILFGILLSMSSYFVILDNASPLQALSRSVYVVSKNFGAVFVRLAVLFGISFVAGIILNSLTSGDGGVALLGSIASLIFNLIYGWFSVAFMMLTIQDAKKVAGEGRGKLMWLVMVAAIGWVLLLGGGYFLMQSLPSTTTTLPNLNQNLPLNGFSDEELLDDLIATPAASLAPIASPSPRTSVRPTASPRVTATPRASAATSSANR